MAIALVAGSGTKTAGSSSTLAHTFGTNPVVGDMIIVPFSCFYGSTSPTCADNYGNTYTSAVLSNGIGASSNNKAGIFWAPVTTTGASFATTLTGGAGSYWSGSFDKWSGLATVSPVDQTAIGNATGVTLTITTGTTTQNDEVAICAFCSNVGSLDTFGADPTGNGFTELFRNANGATAEVGVGDYLILSATGTVSASFLVNSGNAMTGCIATFKAAGAAATPFFGQACL